MVWWCLSVRPSGSPSVRLSVRPSVRPSVRVSVRQFSTLFSNMLWHIELKFCTWLCFTVLQIKFECRQFASSFVGVMLLLELRILEIHIFRTFLLHALTYWAEILDMPLFSVLQIKFECRQFASSLVGVMPLLELIILEIQFTALFSYMLWHIELKFCTWLCFTEIQIKFECRQFASIFVGVMPPLELRILEIHNFPHFSLTCFDILSCNFAYNFVVLYYRSSSSVVNVYKFLWQICPFWNSEYWNSAFRIFLLHALTYWAEILHMTLFYCTTDQVRVSSICVNFCGS